MLKGRKEKKVTHRPLLRIFSRQKKTMTEKSYVKGSHSQRTPNTKDIAIMKINSVCNRYMQI